MIRSTLSHALCFATLVCVGCSDSDDNSPSFPAADLVISNGYFYTVDEQLPVAEAVAITEGRFVYVGSDENGEPTGWVKEFGAIPFFLPFESVYLAPFEDREIAMVEFLESLAALGVTTLYDAGTTLLEDATYEIVAKLEREGRLPVRYEGTYHIILPEQVSLAEDSLAYDSEVANGGTLRQGVIAQMAGNCRTIISPGSMS